MDAQGELASAPGVSRVCLWDGDLLSKTRQLKDLLWGISVEAGLREAQGVEVATI